MANTPVSTPPRYSSALQPEQLDTSERDLFELLRKALEPSFSLVRRIGAGGMGIVYLARDPALKRLVAVKVMSPERAVDDEARARFQREAEAVAKIAHPNVVAIHSVGALENGLPYLVMQYVEGRSMAERLVHEGPLGVLEAKSVIGQVASALAAAHAKGVVHRDVKSANILWDDASGRALVSDFGIAALLEGDGDEDPMHLTQTGAVVGTPKFMSPEQLLAERVSEKTDVYSLGLLAYELLAREGPFPEMSSPNQMIVAHLRDAPRPISSLRADVDPAFEALLAACLEKDQHARPDADDIARRLRHSTSVVLEWPPPGLEELQGSAVAPARRMLVGGLAVAIPMTILTSTQPGQPLYLNWPASAALPVLLGIGALAWVSAVGTLARIVPLVTRAAKAGYGFDVLCSVLVDSEKDLGAVIAGEREYAALPQSHRDRIRRWRIARVALTLGGSTWAIVGVLAALPLGARLGSEGLFATTLLGIPLATQLASLWLWARERKLVGPVRERLRRFASTVDRMTNLAASWRSAFERLRGESMRTATAAFRRAAVLGAVALSLAVASGVTMVTLTSVAAAGKFAAMVGAPSYAGVAARYRLVNRMRYLRLPVDLRITPLEAGNALNALQSAGSAPPALPAFRPPSERLPAVELPATDQSLFGGEWEGGNAMRAAARGLSAAQRDFLARAAAQPGRRQVEILAYAPDIYWFSATVPKAAFASILPYDVQVPRFSAVKRAMSAHIARAILARADGRVGDAERMVREVMSAGFNLMQGRLIITNLIGEVEVVKARDELVALYETSGRSADARPITKSFDPPPDPAIRTTTRLSAEDQIAQLEQLIRDSTGIPGVRWEAVTRFAAIQPCAELRDIVFGPSPQYYELLDEARARLVRTPGDDALMGVAEHILDKPLPESRLRNGFAPRAVIGVARAIDALTGSHRAAVCTSLFAGMIKDY